MLPGSACLHRACVYVHVHVRSSVCGQTDKLATRKQVLLGSAYGLLLIVKSKFAYEYRL